MHSEVFQSIVEFRRSNRKFDPEIEIPEEVMIRSLEHTVLSPNSSNIICNYGNSIGFKQNLS